MRSSLVANKTDFQDLVPRTEAGNWWTRTSHGDLSIVGNWDDNGLDVNNWNGKANSNVGVGASRQSSLCHTKDSPKESPLCC